MESRLMRIRAVTMRYCPNDRELGKPMYPWPCRFSRSGFQETLAAGYWPDGAEFDYALEYHGKPTRWRVSGCYLHEVGTGRVAEGKMRTDNHVTVKPIEAAVAAKVR